MSPAERASAIQRALTGHGCPVTPSQRIKLILPHVRAAENDALERAAGRVEDFDCGDHGAEVAIATAIRALKST